jgi:hypothetical protein
VQKIGASRANTICYMRCAPPQLTKMQPTLNNKYFLCAAAPLSYIPEGAHAGRRSLVPCTNGANLSSNLSERYLTVKKGKGKTVVVSENDKSDFFQNYHYKSVTFFCKA